MSAPDATGKVSRLDERYYTLDVGIYWEAESYRVVLTHRDPNSQARVAPERGKAALNPTELLELQGDDSRYGMALFGQLFAEDKLLRRLREVEVAAAASDHLLQITLSIDPSAQELQTLRWELLRNPETGSTWTSSERVLFSRFLVSRDWRPVQLRAKTDLVALIAISAPEPQALRPYRLAPVDLEGELAGAKAALQGVKLLPILGGPAAPLTLDRLAHAMRPGVDIVYLVSHGRYTAETRTPLLYLQDEQGGVAPVGGEALAEKLSRLPSPPRLMVLASCQSAGDGDPFPADARPAAPATLAVHLAGAGVPAIVAMQGQITMKTVAAMMPTLLTELLADGRIDRALAVARGKVADRDDAWMPALFSRLDDCRVWYVPGFRLGSAKEEQEPWVDLCLQAQRGKLVPILGPGLLTRVVGAPEHIARRLSDTYNFPLLRQDRADIPRVRQYVEVLKKNKRSLLIEAYKEHLIQEIAALHGDWLPAELLAPSTDDRKLDRLLKAVGEHLRADENPDAFRLLAELPSRLYVTTNQDRLLEDALKARGGRTPISLSSPWRVDSSRAADLRSKTESGSRDRPLVYHALGAFRVKNAEGEDEGDDTLVLTEDNTFDFLIRTAPERLMPDHVGAQLTNNSLLFLGFRLTDWSFRVLFRMMMSLENRARLKKYPHVAVQLDPELADMADVARAKEYLARYFQEEVNIRIFWGSAEDYLSALLAEVEKRGGIRWAPLDDDDD